MNDPFQAASDAFVASIHASVQNVRDSAFANSPQLTLGELIDKLEAIEDVPKDSKRVRYDFEYAYPTTLDCWRGSYNELALGFGLEGYGHNGPHFAENGQTVKSLITHLKEAIGKTYQGWKGGDFVMSRDTPVWVANPGNSGSTGIVGVTDILYEVVINTAYCEF